MEAMSLLGLISEWVGMLDLLYMIIPVSIIVHSHLRFILIDRSNFLQDGKRIVIKIRQLATRHPFSFIAQGWYLHHKRQESIRSSNKSFLLLFSAPKKQFRPGIPFQTFWQYPKSREM